jgi:hypothetical protein
LGILVRFDFQWLLLSLHSHLTWPRGYPWIMHPPYENAISERINEVRFNDEPQKGLVLPDLPCADTRLARRRRRKTSGHMNEHYLKTSLAIGYPK